MQPHSKNKFVLRTLQKQLRERSVQMFQNDAAQTAQIPNFAPFSRVPSHFARDLSSPIFH
jgi:hypothetical protein